MLGDKEIEYKVKFSFDVKKWSERCTLENIALKLFYRVSKKFKEH